MASNAQRYAVGIGTGAASGAALGSSILPGWGTAIGAALGAGAGAIGAATGNSDEEKRRRLIEEQRAREKKMVLLELLRNQAVQNGYDPTLLDTTIKMKGLDYQNALEDRAYANANRLDPNAFVQMAQQGALAARGIYNGFNQAPAVAAPATSNQFQLTPMQGSLLDEDYANATPKWAMRLQL